MSKLSRWLLKLVKENRFLLLFVLLILIPVRSSLADWNWVPTGSMKPNILEGDMIFINKAAYDLRIPLTLKRVTQYADPKRGDIVVCFSPEDGTRLVKRVVAIPGDTISMTANQLRINGQPAQLEPRGQDVGKELQPNLRFASNFATETIGDSSRLIMETPLLPDYHRNFSERTLQTGQYFLIGDNRDNSRDSREFGPVGRHLIVGKARSIVLSFNKLDQLKPRFGRWFSNLQ